MTPYQKLYRDLEDFFDNRIDLETLHRENKQLEALNNEVQKSQQALRNIQTYILKE